ncbi:MAG: anthranilate phosphoribosyltransferase [Promethearchaeota archaeon]
MYEKKIIMGIKKISKGIDLSMDESEGIMREIMSGNVSESQLGALLMGLTMKGEHIDEITGFAKVMREFANEITPQIRYELLDTCGTGGDKVKTFNISTLTAIIAAAAGIPVAKHGNRAVTSKCGSADLLEQLGIKIDLPPKEVEKCIENIGIGFMYAPLFHPAMKYAMPTRKALKIRTIFNILGPLTNPAGVKNQILGVFQKDFVQILAKVLNRLGARHIITVYNSYGIDELAPTGINYLCECKDGFIHSYAITNEDFGLKECSINEITIKDPNENRLIALKLLKGEINDARLDTVLMNSSAALVCADIADDFKEGVEIARNIIEEGIAFKKLEEFVSFTGGNPKKLNLTITA